ncbi:DUF3834 domain-containing protein [Acidianus brierleyi]|uniref:Uncharacterized protein n=1 Tax=Acidianus brierleyi TaxID=41673 RepID=A0A2U9IDP1_9CREN|nr:DUF3834 domain-containing protein [Acidianus brierleyi]AWR94145.1 DUF3834 domain-containing protein [Acidianus brierleyi]
MKISSPIGPVSYPLIASQMKRHDFELLLTLIVQTHTSMLAWNLF